MKRTLVDTGVTVETTESFARAVAVDNWIYVSNSSGYNYKTGEISSNVAEQTNRALDNVSNALEAVGSSLSDVVRRLVIIPDVANAAEVMAIVGERFRGMKPTSTVLCSPLGGPEFLVEIELTAYRGIGSAETETISI